MKLLLDTHILLWVALGRHRVPLAAATLIADPANQLFFSTVSIWEAAIKFALRRADFPLHPQALRGGLFHAGYNELFITSEQVFGVTQLPPIHRDPFDRLLLAQAISEKMTLLTADATIASYPGPIQRI